MQPKQQTHKSAPHPPHKHTGKGINVLLQREHEHVSATLPCGSGALLLACRLLDRLLASRPSTTHHLHCFRMSHLAPQQEHTTSFHFEAWQTLGGRLWRPSPRRSRLPEDRSLRVLRSPGSLAQRPLLLRTRVGDPHRRPRNVRNCT
jgi:hypothetical protein